MYFHAEQDPKQNEKFNLVSANKVCLPCVKYIGRVCLWHLNSNIHLFRITQGPRGSQRSLHLPLSLIRHWPDTNGIIKLLSRELKFDFWIFTASKDTRLK